MSSASDNPSARDQYRHQLQECKDALIELNRVHAKLIWVRSCLFATATVGLLIGYFSDFYSGLMLTAGWAAAALFLVAIVRHEHLRLRRLSLESDQALCEQLLARLDRDWDHLETRQLLPQYRDVPYADDLDIEGYGGLLSLLSLCCTHPGIETLQGWLTTPGSWPQIEDRQQAVRQLASMRDLRMQMIKTLRATGVNATHPYGLPAWSRTQNWLPRHTFAGILSYVGPGIVGLSSGLLVAGWVLGQSTLLNVGVAGLACGFVLNILVTVFWGSWIHEIFQKVTGEHRACYQFASVFELMGQLPEGKNQQGLLDQIRITAVESPQSAKIGFAKLVGIVRLANLQRDPLLYFVYLAMQLVFLYDFRVLRRLEKWKDRFGSAVESWFQALGNCEAFVCGATLADEYPDWVFPAATTSDDVLVCAEQMGHPLLRDDQRVRNNLELQRSKPLLVVTGSNMAGKSTFLRSLGINLLLMRIGAPVCARRLEAPIYELATSIRIKDSLSDGVSFFMAELKRLKEIVDLARCHAQDANQANSAQMLFLLDEILQGTNSQERQIAVASVLEQLLAYKAVGLISTHDLDLAEAEAVRDVSQVVHFREFFEFEGDREVMKFDYRIRPGCTPTTNALKLLELVGLAGGPAKNQDRDGCP